MSETIVCPSGLSGEIRGLKVQELNLLADRRVAKSGQQLERILASCWQRTLDPGPYALGAAGLDWGQVLQGDRFYALLRMRILSLGADYAFSVVCQNEGCCTRIAWEVALDDLPVKLLSDESRACFQDGNRFEAWLPQAAVRVWFRLLVGADEQRFARMRQASPDRLWSAKLALHIVEIEGIDSSQRSRFIEDLALADAEFLRCAFERVDCGVETTIEIECPVCMMPQDVDLPFDHRFFLAESRRRPAAPAPCSPR